MEAMARLADGDLTRVIASAVAGDDLAFGHIVAAHEAEMHRICVAVSRDQAIAADAVQAAWAIAWRKLGAVREPGRLRPWLVAIAVNEAKQLMRKRQRRSQVEALSPPPAAAGGVDPATGIDSLDLDAALMRLDPDDRALLAMRYVAGFDATELSIAIGLSPSGTRSRLERLIARLREELA
jgi:RNA polymerase sigma factor (sigma-70 family)